MPEADSWRSELAAVVTSAPFGNLAVSLVLLNMIVMCMPYYGMSDAYAANLDAMKTASFNALEKQRKTDEAIEAERLAKEDKIRAEQLEKSKAAISGRRPGSARKSVGGAPAPPPPPEALKGFALVLPPDKIKASPPSKSQVTSQRHQQVDDNENEDWGGGCCSSADALVATVAAVVASTSNDQPYLS